MRQVVRLLWGKRAWTSQSLTIVLSAQARWGQVTLNLGGNRTWLRWRVSNLITLTGLSRRSLGMWVSCRSAPRRSSKRRRPLPDRLSTTSNVCPPAVTKRPAGFIGPSPSSPNSACWLNDMKRIVTGSSISRIQIQPNLSMWILLHTLSTGTLTVIQLRYTSYSCSGQEIFRWRFIFRILWYFTEIQNIQQKYFAKIQMTA